MSRPAACTLAAVSCLSMVSAGTAPLAKDYLLTAAKPDKLVMVDPAARKVERTCDIPDPGTGVLTIVPAPAPPT